MVFRFFATPAGGSDLLADAHSGVSTATLNGGLFSVQLGSGVVTPGPACLDCTTLARVFRKISPVYMEIQVQTEILSPRIPVASAAYALNAGNAPIDNYRQGMTLVYKGPFTVAITNGVADLGGTGIIQRGESAPINVTNMNDFASGFPGSNQWQYVIFTDSGTQSPLLRFTTDPPNASDAGGTTTGLLEYRIIGGTTYRYLGAVRTDGFTNLLKFSQVGQVVLYDSKQSVLFKAPAAGTFTAVSLASFVPATSTSAYLTVGGQFPAGTDMDTGIQFRPTGSSAPDGQTNMIGSSGNSSMLFADTNGSQSIDYRHNGGGTGQISIYVSGYVSSF